MSDPSVTPSPSLADRRSRTWPGFLGGLAATVVAVVALVNLWPESDRPDVVSEHSRSSPDLAVTSVPATPRRSTLTSTVAPVPPDRPTDLFAGDAADAVAAVQVAAGNPAQLYELAIYPTYLFVAYRDPAEPAHIDRREWRGGVGDAEPNLTDDRVDAESEPKLFTSAEMDLARLPALVADAPTHYDTPVKVTHILIDRFLPFDQRVLVRVYASPVNGRSGGGYVSYAIDGSVVRSCC